MVKLIIARHGESEWNTEGRYQGLKDPPLTERGRKQAELLARELKKESIDFIFSSPLKRAFETAKIIGDHLGIEPVIDRRIIEIDHGVWSGMLVSEVKEKFREDFEKWISEPHKVVFPEGESLEDVYKRVSEFINDIKRDYGGKTLLVVSHTVPIRCMYCALLNVDLSRFWSFGCDNASYSLVFIEDDRSIINRLNITCHLGELYVEAHKAL